jgi:hypothetical protein
MTTNVVEGSCLKSPSNIVLFRFYEELNDYLPKKLRKRDIEVLLKGPRTLRSIIKSFDIPLSEVDLILVNGVSADFEYVLDGGERVSVYPVFELLNIRQVTRVRETPLRNIRFIADADLTEMAGEMQRSGFDVVCFPNISWEEIREISIKERRIILTKSKAIVELPGVTHAVLIHSEDRMDQRQEVMELFGIEKPTQDFC